MKANELRIGNWVLNGGGKPIQCTSARICDIDNKLLVSAPIPLTPDILEKAGFEFKPIGNEVYEQIWSFNDFEIWEHDEGFCHSFHMGGDINSCHQLQNLYYSLTGEELTINN